MRVVLRRVYLQIGLMNATGLARNFAVRSHVWPLPTAGTIIVKQCAR